MQWLSSRPCGRSRSCRKPKYASSSVLQHGQPLAPPQVAVVNAPQPAQDLMEITMDLELTGNVGARELQVVPSLDQVARRPRRAQLHADLRVARARPASVVRAELDGGA